MLYIVTSGGAGEATVELVRLDHKRMVADPNILRVLGQALFVPRDEAASQVALDSYWDPARLLFGLRESGKLIGVAGIQFTGTGEATILHIAIDTPYRGRGFGRHLLSALVAREGLVHLEAETDREAVGFYRKAGFSVQSLGEKYPGVERFACHWAKPATPHDGNTPLTGGPISRDFRSQGVGSE